MAVGKYTHQACAGVCGGALNPCLVPYACAWLQQLQVHSPCWQGVALATLLHQHVRASTVVIGAAGSKTVGSSNCHLATRLQPAINVRLLFVGQDPLGPSVWVRMGVQDQYAPAVH
jgi:hypothetical protein